MTMEWSGNIIKKKRMTLRLTQRQLAELIGCRAQTVSDWEVGTYTPRDAYAVRLTEIFSKLDKGKRK